MIHIGSLVRVPHHPNDETCRAQGNHVAATGIVVALVTSRLGSDVWRVQLTCGATGDYSSRGLALELDEPDPEPARPEPGRRPCAARSTPRDPRARATAAMSTRAGPRSRPTPRRGTRPRRATAGTRPLRSRRRALPWNTTSSPSRTVLIVSKPIVGVHKAMTLLLLGILFGVIARDIWPRVARKRLRP